MLYEIVESTPGGYLKIIYDEDEMYLFWDMFDKPHNMFKYCFRYDHSTGEYYEVNKYFRPVYNLITNDILGVEEVYI